MFGVGRSAYCNLHLATEAIHSLFHLLQGVLQKAHSANASYLFQQDKFYDVSYDTGDKSIQCGRKVDVLKVWMMWKAKGHIGFQAKIDNAFDMAGYVMFV